MIKRSCWIDEDEISESDGSLSMSDIMLATFIKRGNCCVIRVKEGDGSSPDARSKRFEYDLDTIFLALEAHKHIKHQIKVKDK